MRKALHAILAIIGILPWAAAMTCMWLVMQISVLADRIWPEADRGNCWSFALPRWRKRGGYLAIRPSLRPFQFIPHAIWVYELPAGTHLEQTKPVKRARHWTQAWRSFYFTYRVAREERAPGHTRPAPLGDR